MATSLGFGVIQLDVSVVNVAIKPIGAAFGAGVGSLQWVVSAYTLALAALILTAGALGDRAGAKRFFVAGFLLFTAASAACGLAPSLGVLIAARAIQGAAASVLVPSSLSLLNHTFAEPGERARAVGFWAAGATTTLAAGPLVGGVLIEVLGWRSIFFINAPIGLVGIFLTLRYTQETTRSAHRGVDVPGALTAIVFLAALAAAVIETGARGFGNPLVIGGYALTVLAILVFLHIERTRRHPMLPLSLFRSRTFSIATTIGLLLNIAFYGLIFVLSLFFQRAQHLSSLQTGLAFGPTTASIFVANVLAGRADARFGHRRTIAFGALLMMVALATLLGTGAGTPYSAMVVQLVVLGFGIGLQVPAITAALLGSVDRSRSGVASGTLNSSRQTGSVIGVALFGALVDSGGTVSGLHIALIISVGLAVVVAALTFGLTEGREAPAPSMGETGRPGTGQGQPAAPRSG